MIIEKQLVSIDRGRFGLNITRITIRYTIKRGFLWWKKADHVEVSFRAPKLECGHYGHWTMEGSTKLPNDEHQAFLTQLALFNDLTLRDHSINNPIHPDFRQMDL